MLKFYQGRPPTQQGVIISVLLGNALLAVTVDGVVVVAIVRGAVHSWRDRRLGPVAAMRTDMGPALCGALVVTTIQWAAARALIRAVDTGRAAAWLARTERWLTRDQPPAQPPGT
jgi:hypothetical protein